MVSPNRYGWKTDDDAVEALLAALQAQLDAAERKLERFTLLATESKDKFQQDEYWHLAQDAQWEARSIREEISRLAPHLGRTKWVLNWLKSRKSLR